MKQPANNCCKALTALTTSLVDDHHCKLTVIKPLMIAVTMLTLIAPFAGAATLFTNGNINVAGSWTNGLPAAGNVGTIDVDGWNGISVFNFGSGSIVNQSAGVITSSDAFNLQGGTWNLFGGKIVARYFLANGGKINLSGGSVALADVTGTRHMGVANNGTLNISGSAILDGTHATTFVQTTGGTIDIASDWNGSWRWGTYSGSEWQNHFTSGQFKLGGKTLDATLFNAWFNVTEGGKTLALKEQTYFMPTSGSADIFSNAAWFNGFPKIANNGGIIAADGTFISQYKANEATSGNVTISHVAGTVSGAGWNFHNTGTGYAVYHWNQSGGNVSVRDLHPNVNVIYTLSGAGRITGNAGGARIQCYNTGLFRQTGGTLVDMGIEHNYATTLELSGGNAIDFGKNIPEKAFWGHGTSSATISISGTHALSFDAGISAANAIVLEDGAQLVFDPAWQGSWHRQNFTEADWIIALTDIGVKVGDTQVTASNFSNLFTVAQAGAPGSSIQLGLRTPSSAPSLPVITSANLTAHFNAGDINNDGGITDPGPGAHAQTWADLVSGQSLSKELTAPPFIAEGDNGINSRDTLRFRATATAGDLLHNNNLIVTARTVFAVASMAENASGGLSTLIADKNHNLNIRQTTAETANYFNGNSADFIVHNSSGVFNINGNPRLDIPGGFDTPHVIKAIRNSNVNYNGFRFSDNIETNRRWNGDVAEVLIFDGVLDGNDTARINQYLAQKYAIAQVVDERLTDTRQVADAPFLDYRLRHTAVNFYYAPGGDTAGRLHGIAFDNINLTGATPPTGPFTLSANQPYRTLTLNFPFTENNEQRTQNAGIIGTDSNTLNTVANEYFYISPPGSGHDSATMIFAGMGPTNQIYVQVFGGDARWSGDLDVTANNAPVGRWMTVADGNSATASTFAFLTASDLSGSLKLVFTGVNHFSGIGGIILTEAVPFGLPGTNILIR
ncbi:MAG: hypothetical protein PHO37_06705 [Kiritimatiellae bacterium]|nr:hypothetical protein [Kiritimatiellia bacterium]